MTRGQGDDAVQRCNCGGAACKSEKVRGTITGGRWRPQVAGGGRGLTQGGTGDRMIGWGIKFRVTATRVSASRPSATGAWSRLPKAEWLNPEGLRPGWPSPVTRKNMTAASYPVSGFRVRVGLKVGRGSPNPPLDRTRFAVRRRTDGSESRPYLRHSEVGARRCRDRRVEGSGRTRRRRAPTLKTADAMSSHPYLKSRDLPPEDDSTQDVSRLPVSVRAWVLR